MSKTKKLRKAQERQKNKKTVPDRSQGNKIFIAVAAVLAVVIIAVVCVEQLSRKLAAKVGEEKIYQDEMMYYVQQEEQQASMMDGIYKQIYGTSYWDYQTENGVSGREQSQTSIEEQMVMDEILSQEAKASKTALTEEEEASAKEEAKAAFDTVSSSVRSKYGISLSKYEKICKKRALADKYKKDLIAGFDIDKEAIKAGVDYETYRQYDVLYYYMPIEKGEESSEEAGEEVSAEEEKAAKEKAKRAILDIKGKIDAGAEFKSLADTASKAGITVSVDSTTGVTKENPVFGEEAFEEIKKLPKDAVSEVVETDDGCYLFQMVDDNSSEAYDSKVESEISKEEESRFETEYNEVLFPKYKAQIKTGLWENIKLGSIFTQS